MFKKTMKIICVNPILILVIMTLFFWEFAFADLPQQFFFQAKLSKKDKTTLSGSHSFIFRLYSASTGGSSLWSETQSITADSLGIISCYLGSSTAFPSTLDFNSTYYLSVEVDSDGEMSPRIKVVPSFASLNADRYDSLNSLQFLRSDTSDTMEGTLTFSAVGTDITTGTDEHLALMPNGTGNVGIGITSPSARLDIRGQGTGTGFAFRIANSTPTDRLVVLDNGNVGIGTTSPLALLQAGTSPTPGLFVTAAGNVGIGKTSPSYKLDIDGIMNCTGVYENGSPFVGSQWTTSGSNIYYNTGNVGIGNTSPLALLQVGTSPTPGLFVIAGGNVGIGTTNPLQKLQVAGDLNIETGSGIMLNNTATSGEYLRGDGTRFVSGTIPSGDLPTISAAGGWTDDGTIVRLTASGDNVGIGRSDPSAKLHIFGAGTTTGFAFRISDTTPTDRLVVLDSGNVGIGTTNPLALLQVGTSPTPGLFVTAGGNVGIATTDPVTLLHVGTSPSSGLFVFRAGNVAIGTTESTMGPLRIRKDQNSGTTIFLENTADNTNVWSGYFADAGSSNPTRMILETFHENFTTVNSSIADSVLLQAGGNASAGLSLQASASSAPIRFWTGGNNERMRIDGNGNVGIGWTSPYGLLQVGTAPTNPGLIVTRGNNVGIGTTDPTSTLHIVSSGSMAIPQGTAPTVDAAGEIAIDTTDDQFIYYGGGTRVIPYTLSRCVFVEDLVAADDNMSLGMWNDAVTITGVGCSFVGTGTTTATFTLEDGGGTAMTITGTNPTCVANTSNATFAAVTANNSLVAGETVQFDTTNTPNPTTDDYTVCVTYTWNAQ